MAFGKAISPPTKHGLKRAQEEPAGPHTPTEEGARREVKKQELVKKLSAMVSSGTGGGSSSSATQPVSLLQSLPCRPSDAAATELWGERVSLSRVDALATINENLAGEAFLEPMDQARVSSKVEDSLGPDLGTFASYQGTIHDMMRSGLNDTMLDGFLFDEEHERQLTTYDKWASIRVAAEQVLQVYANRSNSSWIEAETWGPPTVVEAASVAGATGFSSQVDRAFAKGNIALMFVDDGRLCERGGADGPSLSPLLSTDLWQAVKELAPNKVPSTQRLERLSVVGRQLLHAAVSLEMWYGADALAHTRVVVCVDEDQEGFLCNELVTWGHFGFGAANLSVLPLPRFHGFAQDAHTGRLAHLRDSSKLLMGTGYALFLTNAPAEAYTLTEAGEPTVLADSVLGWLDRSGVAWVTAGLLADVERLRPGAMLDAQFLSAALYASDVGGANMAMEVVKGTSERDARTHDSLVLRRSGGEPGYGGRPGGELSLRPSCMRTVRSYQIIKEQLSAPGGFYVATQRWAFKVPALRSLLVDASQFKADVRLNSFYAHASFDWADVAGFAGARCACVSGAGLKGPAAEPVCSAQWLNYVAPILELQDQVDCFRSKAVQLIRSEGLVRAEAGADAGSGFKERKRAFTVVIPLTLEHAKLAPTAIRMARLFLKHIVDRLHLLVVLGPNESKAAAKTMLSELGDKELDFQGQIVRSSIFRGNTPKEVGAVAEYCQQVDANVVVVPSARLCGPVNDLGTASSSLALAVVRTVTSLPLVIVKANSAGKFSSSRNTSGPGMPPPPSQWGEREHGGPSSALHNTLARAPIAAMAHLDMHHASPLVEAVSPFLTSKGDALYLSKTQAFERGGELSMRARRMFVQARMAAPSGLRVEERAYGDAAAAELPRAVETEGVDLLLLTGPGILAPGKETEELLKTVRCCVYIHRTPEAKAAGIAAAAAAAAEEAAGDGA